MNLIDIENNFKEELKDNTTKLSFINFKKYFEYLDKDTRDKNKLIALSIFDKKFTYLIKIINKGTLSISFEENNVNFSFVRKIESIASISGTFKPGRKIENCHQISILFNLFND